MKVERSFITGEVTAIEISDAISMFPDPENPKADDWMICLDRTVIEVVRGRERAFQRAITIDIDRQSVWK